MIESIPAAMSAITTSIKLATTISNSDTELEKAELRLKLAELMLVLADAKLGILNMQESLLAKDKELRGLHEKSELKESVSYEAPFYYMKTESEKKGPFCQKCWDDKEKLARLIDRGIDRYSDYMHIWYCNICKSAYEEVS